MERGFLGFNFSGKEAQLPDASLNILVSAVEAYDHAIQETELRYVV